MTLTFVGPEAMRHSKAPLLLSTHLVSYLWG